MNNSTTNKQIPPGTYETTITSLDVDNASTCIGMGLKVDSGKYAGQEVRNSFNIKSATIK